MAQHAHYWSCSKFADWIRGTPTIVAGTGSEWNAWDKKAKEFSPIRYWIAEEGLQYLQDFVTWPVRKLYDIKYYINNRWVTRTHSLTAHPRDITPGKWCDVGNRFLPCLFNELVDFVEIESAWSHIAWGSKEDRAKYRAPFWSTGWFRWRVWRCPQAGLDHLEWASKLTVGEDWGIAADDSNFGKPTSQAERAVEILALYKWWTEVYRNRQDPMDISGWSEFCDRKREGGGGVMSMLEDNTPEEQEESRTILDLCHKIEQEQDDEDTEMMIRLIKARDSLWT
jgi:hypothetical protein